MIGGKVSQRMSDNQAIWNLFEELRSESDPAVRRIKSEALWRLILGQKRNPICIGNRALFLHLSSAQQVAIVGEWSYWQEPVVMERLPDTQLFYCTLEFPPHSRLQYKLICDGEWIIDPANAILSPEGFGVNSEFQMPEYQQPKVLQLPQQSVPHGRVEKHTLHSARYGERSFFLYTPAVELHNPLPLLIVHDGEEALRLGQFHRLLDVLIAHQTIEPCAALFIPPGFRNAEYTDPYPYSAFCFEEVLPKAEAIWKEQQVPITAVAYHRVVMGASLAGRLATLQLLLRPQLLGGCIAQSPSYWWRQGDIFRMPILKNARGKKVILQTGTIADAQTLTRKMAEVLLGLSAEVVLLEYAQGHSWSNWRLNFGDAMIAWLGKPHHRRELLQQQRKAVGE